MTAQRESVRLPQPLRVLTLSIAMTMAFALGFLFAFATRLQPHLVAISCGVAVLGAVYCVALAVYVRLTQARGA